MKKAIFFLIIFNSITFCNAQEWFTSLEVAKRLALVQDKMLFVMWEGSVEYEFSVFLSHSNRVSEVVDLRNSEYINQMIWDNFVPVLLPEYEYSEFSDQVKKTRGLKYYNKLIDDTIKIMDVNGNILNIDDTEDINYFFDINGNLKIVNFINRYALNTSYLRQELENHLRDKNLNSTFYLASKYLDYAIFVKKKLRPEIIAMANIYFDDVETYLEQGNIDNSLAIHQRLELLKLKEDLILNQPKKVKRLLKKLDEENIDKINYSLFSFLNYTTFMLLNKTENTALWKDKVSSIDLRLAGLILNNTIDIGKDN